MKEIKPNNYLKIILIALILIVLTIAAIRFIVPEDGWICIDGQWQKHGNPSAGMPPSGCTR